MDAAKREQITAIFKDIKIFSENAASAGDILAHAICEKALYGTFSEKIVLTDQEKQKVDDMNTKDCFFEACRLMCA